MNKTLTTLFVFLVAVQSPAAFAHFIWLSPSTTGDAGKIAVYFGEAADDDSSDYLDRVSTVVVSRVTGSLPAEALTLSKSKDSISTPVKFSDASVYVASHDLGIMDRGDSSFRLKYYAKTGPNVESNAWQTADSKDDLRLDIVPSRQGDKIQMTVYFDQQPVSDVEVTVARPNADSIQAVTNEAGAATFELSDAGLYSIRARHIDSTSGELNGKKFPETRHYSTVSLLVPAEKATGITAEYDSLPEPVTSFGAAIAGQALYMYGGHTGSAHSYSTKEQSNQLTRLNLQSGKWETLAEGPHLQGLALVAHGDKLYRIGGFTAMNAEGEEHELVSQNTVASFDPATKVWQELPALPERRSSHDAAVVGDCIYVVGGWKMGDEDTQWHSTAWKLDLTLPVLHWQPIAAPGFHRRALALAAHNGKLYVVGGMQEKGGPTTSVAVYNPADDSWADGPALFVKADPVAKDSTEKPVRSMSSGAMAGFGASAFATGGSLYVTTVQGNLQKLSEDGSKWEVVKDDLTPRFFHRILPLTEDKLVVVGGSNMSIGKFEEVEVIDVKQ